MHRRSPQRNSPIAVVTSPTGETSPLTERVSPPTPKGTGPPVQYRIEDHRRTIYVTSSLPPGKWDKSAIDQLLKLPEIPDEGLAPAGQTERQRRSRSLNENELNVLTDTSNHKPRDTGGSPRSLRENRNLNVSRSQRGGNSSSTPTTPTVSVRGGSPRTPIRHRILFYHRHDPHYGFTNFSAHPVVYNGKKYPTSEHLFQSFKVRIALYDDSIADLPLNMYSSKSIAQILPNTYGLALRGLVWPFHKHADSNQKCDPIGSK